jgi:hypothetical protein
VGRTVLESAEELLVSVKTVSLQINPLRLAVGLDGTHVDFGYIT